MIEFKEYVAKYESLLPVGTSISYTEAERRAGLFLEAQATLINWKHTLSAEKIKLLSMQTVVFAQQMSKNPAKTITETKMVAEASTPYIEAREDLEFIENDISYLKAYMELFQNGHLFYRQMCKEGRE